MSAPENSEAIVNSGTTKHFLTQSTATTLTKGNEISHKTKNTLLAKLPDGQILTTEGEMNLNLPKLPVQANHAHVLPHLSESLFPVPQLTKCGVDVLFTGNKVHFLEKGTTILQGEMKKNL